MPAYSITCDAKEYRILRNIDRGIVGPYAAYHQLIDHSLQTGLSFDESSVRAYFLYEAWKSGSVFESH